MDSYVLLAVTLVFAVYIVFRFRPSFSRRGTRGTARTALRDAKARLNAATTDEERAACLGDAADASAKAGLANGAIGYYMRAMRLDPRSAALVDRAAASLADHPRALETLLWRRLGAETWTGPTAPPAHAAIRHLAVLYAHPPLRHSVRARVFQNALAALAPEMVQLLASSEKPGAETPDSEKPGAETPGSEKRDESSPEPRTLSEAHDDGSAPANP